MTDEGKKRIIHTERWKVLRGGLIEEVVQDSGRIVYRVRVWDDDREAFIAQTFNDEGPAYGFLERIRDDNSAFVNEYDKEQG